MQDLLVYLQELTDIRKTHGEFATELHQKPLCKCGQDSKMSTMM